MEYITPGTERICHKMKKLLLASFYFSMGETECSAHRLVAIESTAQKTDQQDSEEAERVFLKWFPNVYPESKLNHVMVLPAITEGSTYPRIEATVAAGIDIPFGWFTNETKPFVDPQLNDPEDGIVSDHVLIDIDGRREIFTTGRWHFDHGDLEGWWSADEHFQSAIDREHMRWSYLPLARYDKK